MQAWARRIAAITTKRERLKSVQLLMTQVLKRALQITNTCRIRIARKKLRKLRKRYVRCVIMSND